jgi:hypothetical protein
MRVCRVDYKSNAQDLEAEKLTLAYGFGSTDRVTSSAATAQLHIERGRGSNIAAFSLSRADWQRSAWLRLTQLIWLPPGWDGHQGKAVNPTIAEYAYSLLEALLRTPGVPLPSITPLSYGGIALEWHRKGWDVEIEIDAPASHHVYTHELASATEDEFRLNHRLDRLRDVIGKIAD